MNARDALEVIREARNPYDVVITTMGTARDWMAGGIGPLDFVLVPSSMGQATSLGLGLALAQPERRIIVLNGDGSLLMNLGSLVSITAAAPANLVVVVFDNGVYEITGSQPTPGSSAARPVGSVDYLGMARAAGFGAIYGFGEIERWRADVGLVLDSRGPVFACLSVEAAQGGVGPRSPGPAAGRAAAFKERLGVAPAR